jgi:hypothetical protein
LNGKSSFLKCAAASFSIRFRAASLSAGVVALASRPCNFEFASATIPSASRSLPSARKPNVFFAIWGSAGLHVSFISYDAIGTCGNSAETFEKPTAKFEGLCRKSMSHVDY